MRFSRLLPLPVALAIVAPALSGQTAATAADINRLVGPGSVGTLTYRDYSTEARTVIKAALLLTRILEATTTDASWDFRIAYADEPHANRGETVTFSADGRVFRKATATVR